MPGDFRENNPSVSRSVVNWDDTVEAAEEFIHLLNTPENIEQVKGILSIELRRASDFFRAGGDTLLPERIRKEVLTDMFAQYAVATEDTMQETAEAGWDRTQYRLNNIYFILRKVLPYIQQWEQQKTKGQ